jgi:hypothetical protein
MRDEPPPAAQQFLEVIGYTASNLQLLMSEPLPTDRPREGGAASDTDRDAKIEQLLLAGLDHYFAGQHEQAINIWTRALFLDRSHPRARAYIERARSAVAERQRESEELLDSGLAAFNRGEAQQARRLVQAAVDRGAHRDEALALLDRLNRIDQGPSSRQPLSPQQRDRAVLFAEAAESAPSGVPVWAVAAAMVVVLAAGVLLTKGAPGWRAATVRPAQSAPPVAPSAAAALPVPRRGAAALRRAQALAASGRLRDALTVLDQVRSTDPERREADQLRGRIQRQLIGLTSRADVTASAAGNP